MGFMAAYNDPSGGKLKYGRKINLADSRDAMVACILCKQIMTKE